MSDYAEFTGPSYTRPITDLQIQSERCVNWRLEQIPGKGKSQYAYLRQPGLKAFCTTNLGKVRGMYALNGHLYAVVGTHYIQINANGTFIDYTAAGGAHIADDGQKVWIVANNAQQFIVGGGNGYIAQLGTVTLIASPGFPQGQASFAEFLDGFFIVGIGGTNQFRISSLNDGTLWDALDTSSKESRPDFIVAAIQLREEVWFFGSLTIQPFYNNGDASFPIVPNQAAVINAGLVAPAALCRMGNDLFWLELDENGHGVFCRNRGYDKQRISDSAIESVWNLYSSITDAYCWAFQENGHYCVRLSFPSIDANGTSATWEYDVTSGAWTETPYWYAPLAKEQAHRGFCSAVAFDKIFVGDRSNGIIYEMNSSYLDDNGDVIRRVRRMPHLYSEKKRIVYNRLELDGNMGIGLGDPNSPDTYNPFGVLEYSNDGGRTFSQFTYDLHWGEQSDFEAQAFAAGLGSARDRVYQYTVTAPVDWAISAARLDFEVLDH